MSRWAQKQREISTHFVCSMSGAAHESVCVCVCLCVRHIVLHKENASEEWKTDSYEVASDGTAVMTMLSTTSTYAIKFLKLANELLSASVRLIAFVSNINKNKYTIVYTVFSFSSSPSHRDTHHRKNGKHQTIDRNVMYGINQRSFYRLWLFCTTHRIKQQHVFIFSLLSVLEGGKADFWCQIEQT